MTFREKAMSRRDWLLLFRERRPAANARSFLSDFYAKRGPQVAPPLVFAPTTLWQAPAAEGLDSEEEDT